MLAGYSSWICELQVYREREPLSPELRWRATEEDTRHGLLASTCMHTYTFMNMHTYKKGYSQAGKPPSTARKEP